MSIFVGISVLLDAGFEINLIKQDGDVICQIGHDQINHIVIATGLTEAINSSLGWFAENDPEKAVSVGWSTLSQELRDVLINGIQAGMMTTSQLVKLSEFAAEDVRNAALKVISEMSMI